MSDLPEPPQGSQPKGKRFNLQDLVPAKTPVEASIGTLYVRHATATDWKNFEIEDDEALGRVVLSQLCSRVDDKMNQLPLTAEDLKSLIDHDHLALAPVISKCSGWAEIPAGGGLVELGAAAKAAKLKKLERDNKMRADMRKSIDSSYGFLTKSTLEKLQTQMADLSTIRSAISIPESLNAQKVDSILRNLAPPPNIELRMPQPPPFEETPLGRVARESANNSAEVAQKMDALVEVVAGLNQMVIRDVLPAWVKQLEDGQKTAQTSFNQAATSLVWTKWAVIVSAFLTAVSAAITVFATAWQVRVAESIDRDNTAQQQRAETLLRDQLVTQQKLLEQQARDAVATKAAIAALKPLEKVVAPPK